MWLNVPALDLGGLVLQQILFQVYQKKEIKFLKRIAPKSLLVDIIYHSVCTLL